MLKQILTFFDKFFPAQTVYAHCDIPCGIYDPHLAQIASLTVIRMIDLAAEHRGQDLTRYILVKEEHAELVKREIRIIWGDYFKEEHFQKYPELAGLAHKIMQEASKARQTTDRAAAVALLESVNRFAEIFWETKGKKTRRVKAPYKPEEEIVIPIYE